MRIRKLLTLSVLGACAAGLVLAQDNRDAKRPIQVAQKEKGDSEKKPSARMPNYFRSLGLSDQQREKILNVIIEHNEQIDELEDQIAELKAKRDAEVHATLNPMQKAKLAELQMDAKKKRAEKADKNKKPAEAGDEK